MPTTVALQKEEDARDKEKREKDRKEHSLKERLQKEADEVHPFPHHHTWTA